RFHGSELRSYQRHFCAHSLSCAALVGGGSIRTSPRGTPPGCWSAGSRGGGTAAPRPGSVGLRLRGPLGPHREQLGQEAPGVRVTRLRDLLRCPRGDQLAALVAAL